MEPVRTATESRVIYLRLTGTKVTGNNSATTLFKANQSLSAVDFKMKFYGLKPDVYRLKFVWDSRTKYPDRLYSIPGDVDLRGESVFRFEYTVPTVHPIFEFRDAALGGVLCKQSHYISVYGPDSDSDVVRRPLSAYDRQRVY